MKWLTEERPDGIHVVPLDDLIVHHLTSACTCAPSVSELGGTCCCGGRHVLAVRRLVTHNAMDNRK